MKFIEFLKNALELIELDLLHFVIVFSMMLGFIIGCFTALLFNSCG